MQLDYKVPDIVIQSPKDLPKNFWERFEFAFIDNSEKIFTDRFHPINLMDWYAESRDATIELRGHRATRLAASALSRSLVTGLREAAVELPIMDWLDSHRGFIADLVLDSLDTEEEEAINPLNPSYRILEKTWWTRLSETRGFRCGLRPFQISPYAFLSTGIWNNGSLLAMAHLRYHYRHFSQHQFEFVFSIPLSQGIAVDIGTAYIAGHHVEEKKLVLKLSKQFRNGGIVHIGMEAQQHPTFLVGMSLPL